MTDIQDEHGAATQDTGRLSGVGEMLRGAREAHGETVLDVAHALKLSPRQIEAIERERFDLLPGPAFVRGFVRNYARHLGIDAEPLVAGMRRETPSPAVQLAPVRNASGAMPQGSAATHGMFKPALNIIAVVAFALGLGAYFDWFRVADPQIVSSDAGAGGVASPMREPVPQPMPEPRMSLAREAAAPPSRPADDPDAAAAQDTPEPAAEADGSDAAVGDPAADATAAAPAAADATPGDAEGAGAEAGPLASEPQESAAAPAEPPVARDADADTTAASGTVGDAQSAPVADAADAQPPEGAQADDPTALAQLVFRLAGESWIQVRDRSGSIVYTGIGAPDSTRTVQGQPPFAIVIGNATKVGLEYQGEAVDLTPHTRSGGVARMTLE